jgi:arsenite methyltransferase
MEPARRLAIDRLALQPGDRVLDVACGTGKSLALLREQVGPRGEVVGIELSTEMIAQARTRLDAGGHDNVRVVETAAEDLALDGFFDAILFVYTHDVLRSPAALAAVFRHARPGTRIAATGVKLFPWWLGAANAWLLWRSWPYFTTLEGLGRPWSRLVDWVPELEVESIFFGSGYLAHGERP